MSRASIPAPLRNILRALEQRLFAVLFVYGIGRTLLNLCALIFGLYLLDRLLEPPTAVRFVLVACAAGLFLWQLNKDLINPLRQRPAKRDLAAIWERKVPQFKDRLSTAVELADGNHESSAELLSEVTAQAVSISKGLDANKVVPTGRAQRSFLRGAAATAILLFSVWGFPSEAAIFFQRIIGRPIPWPSETQLVLMPAYLEGLAEPVDFVQHGNEDYSLAVARGSVLSLRIRVVGVVPDRILAINDDMSRPMHDLGGGNFVLRLPPLRTDQEFHFRGGDDTDGLPRLRIRAGDAPDVGAWLVRTTPPAYTGLPAEEGAFHEVRLLRGSTVMIRLRPDRATKKVESTLLDGVTETLHPDPKGYYSTEFPITGSGEIVFALTGENGFSQKRAGVLRWTATPDRRPEPRILFPEERWLSVPGGKIPLALAAFDDFGLSQVDLRGRRDQAIELDFVPQLRDFQQVLRLTTPNDFSAEAFEDNRFRFQLLAVDSANPEAQSAESRSPWIEIVPASVEEQRLSERIVRLRERIEGMRDRAATFQATDADPSSRRVRRLLKDLDASLGSAEYYLLERLYSGLDRNTAQLHDVVETHLASGMPNPGILTNALLASEFATPLDRSAMLLDLSRALLQARTGPGAALLAAINENLPSQEAAAELRAQLDGILEILMSWEDFNSAVNLLRSLLERQRSLYLRTQEASER